MPVSAKTYEQVALEDPEGLWELVCGRLRRKPEMAAEHDHTAGRLAGRLSRQLHEDEFDVRMNSGRLRVASGSFYVPDVCVIPRSLLHEKLDRSGRLEVYDAPVPFVAEVWSPSTGEYDVMEKLEEYKRRGDREVWLIHPPRGGESKGSLPYQSDRTLSAWRRQPDGSYTETLYRGGAVQPATLPGVTIDLDTLFD